MTDISYEDMRSCIQEWFAQAISAADVAETYYEVRNETDKQMRFMLRELQEGDNG